MEDDDKWRVENESEGTFESITSVLNWKNLGQPRNTPETG
jgi:hypothetical protein